MAKKTKKIVDSRKETDPSFTIIVDTREKNPWIFTSKSIRDVKYQGLKTGDYTVEGYEDKLCIERKRSVDELIHNIHEPRFYEELKRATLFPYRYLILESTLQDVIDYPMNEDLPPKVVEKIKIRGAYVLKCLNRIQVKYGINIIYCGNRNNAQWVATNLMKEVIDLEYDKSITGQT